MFTFPLLSEVVRSICTQYAISSTTKSSPFSEFLIPCLYRRKKEEKKKNKISIEENLSFERSSPIFTSFFGHEHGKTPPRIVVDIILATMKFILVRGILCHTKFAKVTYKKIAGRKEREREKGPVSALARVNPSDFFNVKLALWKFRGNLSTLFSTVSKNLHLERATSTPPRIYK